MTWTTVAIDGAVLSAALGIVILGSLAFNPRLWIQDAPRRARELLPPLTDAERRHRRIVALLFVLVLAGTTVWSAARLAAREGASLTFGTAFAHFAGVFLLFNAFDLVVIDWLVLLVLRPRFLEVLSHPDLSYEEMVGGYGYHFRAFLKGLIFVAVMSLVGAVLTVTLA